MHNQGGQYSGTSVPVIRAHGEIATRKAILWFLGVTCSMLILGGFLVIFLRPTQTKDVWVIIGPIITAAVSSAGGFFAGLSSQRK